MDRFRFPPDDVGAALLLADLDIGLTLMEVARLSRKSATALEAHRNALGAYRTVFRLLKHVNADERQMKTIQEKLALLRVRLKGAGYSV
jgi:hypothetical protein